KLLPQKAIAVFLEKWGIAPELKVNQVTKEQRLELVRLFKNFEIELDKLDRVDHAVVTSGGINVKEVVPKTMESKLVKNLFFAGEILDVDAYTGGYNLQIAFSTAYAAATHLN
ncbi:MAG: NAD(P)/FAD-dependent oxidoreductase, partial [Oscillospiraceae bacterium]